MQSLRDISGTEVRRHWHLYDEATREFVFDVVWDHLAGILLKKFPGGTPILHSLKNFCGNPSLVYLEMKCEGLSRKQRAQWHEICEALGLNHASTGHPNHRVLTIARLPNWCWEFTNRPPQHKPRKAPRNFDEEDEDVADASFQVYVKFRAHGYDSPEDMLQNEPFYRKLLEMK